MTIDKPYKTILTWLRAKICFAFFSRLGKKIMHKKTRTNVVSVGFEDLADFFLVLSIFELKIGQKGRM